MKDSEKVAKGCVEATRARTERKNRRAYLDVHHDDVVHEALAEVTGP